ncbi:rapamycin-insensitive companion of mTOR-like protein, partial [Euroglyphus maynei]
MQDENVLLSIRNSNVLRKSSFRDWNWDLIIDILKQPYDIMLKLEDKEVRSFCGRLLEFFSPSKRQFSSISKNSSLSSSSSSSNIETTPTITLKMSHGHNEVLYSENPRQISLAAIYFIDFLLQADENHAADYLDEFIHDLDRCLKNIANKLPSSDEILIPSRLLSTLSQKYFLLFGRFTHYASGRKWLKKTHIYQNLIDLIHISTNEIYAKLIISSFDYSEVDFPRNFLSKVLTSSNESSRIYSTKFLRLLLRINVQDFAQWGINLLINQLYDQSSVISLEALDILDEACTENVNYLKKVLEHRPALQNLGDKGIVFFARFASFPHGINMLMQTNTLDRELDRWRKHFNLRYVRLVEDCLNECFTCHQKSTTGKYGRRPDRRNFSQLRSSSMTAHLIPHFYGQLAKTYEGLQIIIQHSLCEEMLSIIHTQVNRFIVIDEIQQQNDVINRDKSDYHILRMKAALWAIGHIGSTDIGLDYLIRCDTNILKSITTLVERSTLLSLRATGFYVLCLFGSTLRGAKELSCFAIINPYNTITTNNNRIRSSSDCNASINHNDNDDKKSKPEYQDSGIVNQWNDTLNRSNNVILLERKRKISAPCFPISSLMIIDDDKIRHDSYESAQTNNSESFTEYSTTSSQSNNCSTLVQHRTFETNNNENNSSLSPLTSITPQSPTRPTPVPIINNKQQTPIVIVNGDDPYPSPMDAYGYAQLIAIQKCRVQSLSGNGFFSFGSSSFSNNSIPDSFPKSIDSINTDTFSLDLFQSKNSTNETFQ